MCAGGGGDAPAGRKRPIARRSPWPLRWGGQDGAATAVLVMLLAEEGRRWRGPQRLLMPRIGRSLPRRVSSPRTHSIATPVPRRTGRGMGKEARHRRRASASRARDSSRRRAAEGVLAIWRDERPWAGDDRYLRRPLGRGRGRTCGADLAFQEFQEFRNLRTKDRIERADRAFLVEEAAAPESAGTDTGSAVTAGKRARVPNHALSHAHGKQ